MSIKPTVFAVGFFIYEITKSIGIDKIKLRIAFILLICYNVKEFKIRGLVSLKKKRISGFTLVELSVVIALLAIITTMVVSFTLMTSRRVSEMTNEKTFYDEFFYVENMVLDPWLNEFDNEDTIINSIRSDYQFEGPINGSDVGANYRGTTYRFTFDGKPKSSTYRTFTSQFPDGKTSTYQCKYITGMKVEIDKRADAYSPSEHYCVVTFSFNYRLSSDKNDDTQTVVIAKALRATK